MLAQLALSLFMGLIFGFICGHLAKKQNKNSTLWFLLGVFFGVLALLSFHLLKLKDRLSNPQLSDTRENHPPLSEVADALNPTPKNNYSLESREWFYLDENRKQNGPLSLELLKTKLQSKESQEKTYLWSEGMDKWKLLKDLPYLQIGFKD